MTQESLDRLRELRPRTGWDDDTHQTLLARFIDDAGLAAEFREYIDRHSGLEPATRAKEPDEVPQLVREQLGRGTHRILQGARQIIRMLEASNDDPHEPAVTNAVLDLREIVKGEPADEPEPIRDIESLERAVASVPRLKLERLAQYAFGGLYIDADEKVDPDRGVSGADYIEHMQGALSNAGLEPAPLATGEQEND